jgi:hypothetical protein
MMKKITHLLGALTISASLMRSIAANDPQIERGKYLVELSAYLPDVNGLAVIGGGIDAVMGSSGMHESVSTPSAHWPFASRGMGGGEIRARC